LCKASRIPHPGWYGLPTLIPKTPAAYVLPTLIPKTPAAYVLLYRSLPSGETDTPVPARAKEWATGEKERDAL